MDSGEAIIWQGEMAETAALQGGQPTSFDKGLDESKDPILVSITDRKFSKGDGLTGRKRRIRINRQDGLVKNQEIDQMGEERKIGTKDLDGF